MSQEFEIASAVLAALKLSNKSMQEAHGHICDVMENLENHLKNLEKKAVPKQEKIVFTPEEKASIRTLMEVASFSQQQAIQNVLARRVPKTPPASAPAPKVNNPNNVKPRQIPEGAKGNKKPAAPTIQKPAGRFAYTKGKNEPATCAAGPGRKSVTFRPDLNCVIVGGVEIPYTKGKNDPNKKFFHAKKFGEILRDRYTDKLDCFTDGLWKAITDAGNNEELLQMIGNCHPMNDKFLAQFREEFEAVAAEFAEQNDPEAAEFADSPEDDLNYGADEFENETFEVDPDELANFASDLD